MNIKNNKALILALIFSSAVLNEATGYRAFNWGETNIACDLDPTCNKLTEEQRELAIPFFGDLVDYDRVSYFERWRFFGLLTHQNVNAYVVFGNMYFGKTDRLIVSQEAHFLHEMTHVWQIQNDYFSVFKNPFDRHKFVERWVEFDPNIIFADLNHEQQAEVIEEIYISRKLLARLSEQGDFGDIPEYCYGLNIFENIAAQELPVAITDCNSILEYN